MESCNSKISELASLRTSAKRLSAPAGRRRCAPPAPRSTGRQLEHQNQRGRDRALFVPPHKSGSAVGQLIGSRTYRQSFQTAAEIVREPLDGGVSPLRLFLLRFDHHGIEIARERASQLRRDRAWLCGFRLANRGSDLMGRTRSGIRQSTGQQDIQHHSERIDIGSRGDRFASYLFRAGVLDRQHPHHGRGRFRGSREVLRIENLCDLVGALRSYGESLKIFGSLASQPADRKAFLHVAAVHVQEGSVLARLGRIEPARAVYEQAISLARPFSSEQGDPQAPYTLADAYSGLGNLCMLEASSRKLPGTERISRMQRAQGYYGESLENRKRIGHDAALSPDGFVCGNAREAARSLAACNAGVGQPADEQSGPCEEFLNQLIVFGERCRVCRRRPNYGQSFCSLAMGGCRYPRPLCQDQ